MLGQGWKTAVKPDHRERLWLGVPTHFNIQDESKIVIPSFSEKFFKSGREF